MGARLQRSWQPHMSEEERKVPSTDPAMVEFLANLQRQVLRVVESQKYRDAQMEDVVDSVVAVSEFLDGAKRERIGKRDGKAVFVVTEFRKRQIPEGSG